MVATIKSEPRQWLLSSASLLFSPGDSPSSVIWNVESIRQCQKLVCLLFLSRTEWIVIHLSELWDLTNSKTTIYVFGVVKFYNVIWSGWTKKCVKAKSIEIFLNLENPFIAQKSKALKKKKKVSLKMKRSSDLRAHKYFPNYRKY